jgi:hypothetical protein
MEPCRSKIQSIAIPTVVCWCLLSFLGCGVFSPYRDIVIRADPEANAGNFIPINIVVPNTAYSKEELDKFKDDVEGWFQLPPEDKERLVQFIADGNIDPQNIRENPPFAVPYSRDHFRTEGISLVLSTTKDLQAKALESGLYVWVRYRFDSDGESLDDKGKTKYCGPSFIAKEHLTGGGAIEIQLQKSGMVLNY